VLSRYTVLMYRCDNLEDQISALLGAKVRLFVPSCVMRELRDMAKTDKAYRGTVALARKFVRHKDACPPEESTSDILLQQIGMFFSPLMWR
jgi:rRNA-processing protein FCF1